MGRPKKATTLTPKDRWDRHIEKMGQFGVKRQYFNASESERKLVSLLCDKLSMSRDELISTLCREKGEELGIYLSDIQREISNDRSE